MSPERKQRLDALVVANGIRTDRARLRREVQSGAVSVIDLIREPPPSLAALPIVKVLAMSRGVGPVKARQILKGVPFLPDMTIPIGRLTQHRRDMIIDCYIEARAHLEHGPGAEIESYLLRIAAVE